MVTPANQVLPKAFRVLSLDGGGIKGTYTASVLAALERMTGSPLSRHFDLVVGTSTGGIIAVALGLGVPAQRVLDLYVQHGPKIFKRGLSRTLQHLWRPKHSQAVLKRALEEIFGGKRLGESSIRLIIPAFNAQSGRVHLFKTAHADRFKQDYKLGAVDVALSTAAAPTYFPAYALENGGCYIDGGVWANCPVLVGVLEATCVLGRAIEDVHVLSVGTTDEPYFVASGLRQGGRGQWLGDATGLFLRAQANAALAQTRLLLGDRLLRIDETVNPKRFALDDSSGVDELKALGERSAREHEARVSEGFLATEASSFVPCHALAPNEVA
jgi:patatin-like phospholipase/acyl hydrolase